MMYIFCSASVGAGLAAAIASNPVDVVKVSIKNTILPSKPYLFSCSWHKSIQNTLTSNFTFEAKITQHLIRKTKRDILESSIC